MQQYHVDASAYFTTVDDIHFLQGHATIQVALEAHTPRTSNEMELVVGDEISLRQHSMYYRNGYSMGKNTRSSRVGSYPLYKVQEELNIVQMPTYPEADRDNQIRDPIDNLEHNL